MTERAYRIETDDPRLGRHVRHDERSKGFPMRLAVDRSTWHDKAVRVYDPIPNPNQTIGCCTGVSKAVQLNSVGSRVAGRVLDMEDAITVYAWATANDPWPGTYPPDDTGSSGLAAAKAAKSQGIGAGYRWLFGGADQVVQTIMSGRTVSVGTLWFNDMFHNEWPAKVPVSLTGGIAGGHQWTARGYDLDHDLVIGRCWWGSFRDFYITRAGLDVLLLDNDGDAHVQDTGTFVP